MPDTPDQHEVCGHPLDGGGTCARYKGHKKEHRSTLLSERTLQYHSMTPAQRRAAQRERRQVAAQGGEE